MKTKTWLRIGLVLGLLCSPLMGPAPVGGAPAATAVSVKPPGGTYTVGATLLVEVWVEDVTDLYGADIQLSFDPARLEVLDSDPGTGGVQVTPRDDLLSPDAVVIRSANNLSGTVQYAVTQLNPSPPVSGSGALFAFTVEMLSAGTAEIAISHKDLSTVDGEPIAAGASPASYSIVTVGALPIKVYLPIIVSNAASAAH